jgi:hypothetical protein
MSTTNNRCDGTYCCERVVTITRHHSFRVSFRCQNYGGIIAVYACVPYTKTSKPYFTGGDITGGSNCGTPKRLGQAIGNYQSDPGGWSSYDDQTFEEKIQELIDQHLQQNDCASYCDQGEPPPPFDNVVTKDYYREAKFCGTKLEGWL